MVSPDQRRGAHAGANRRVARPLRSRGAHADPARFSQHRLPHLSGDPAVAVAGQARSRAAIAAFAPQALHIATEGPLGLGRPAPLPAARHALHDLLPHAISAIPARALPDSARGLLLGAAPVPLARRALHGVARAPCARSCRSADSQSRRLAPRRRHRDVQAAAEGLSRRCRGRIAAYVGRVAVEKNIEAFLKMPWSGQQDRHRRRSGAGAPRRRSIPDAVFAGYRFGEDLAAHLAAADVMVFPSRTDTFGLVNLEAMACGVPVAAYPVTGPIDVIEDGVTGALDDDLGGGRAARVDDRPEGLPRNARCAPAGT